jgi:hypothetical protein
LNLGELSVMSKYLLLWSLDPHPYFIKHVSRMGGFIWLPVWQSRYEGTPISCLCVIKQNYKSTTPLYKQTMK